MNNFLKLILKIIPPKLSLQNYPSKMNNLGEQKYLILSLTTLPLNQVRAINSSDITSRGALTDTWGLNKYGN